MVFAKVLLALSVVLSIALHPSWSPIKPTSFFPPAAPSLEGALAPSPKLLEGKKLFAGLVSGPEDVLSDEEGNFYVSNADGTIKKLWSNGTVTEWAQVGGRPLGIKWKVPGSSMVVCEPFQGLLLVHSNGHVELLSNESEGSKFGTVDNAIVATDGSIFFTDASSKFGLHNYILDILEARPHGRLLKYNPVTRETETVLRDLYFPNGVALSKEEDYLLFTETSRYRIMKLNLKGPKAGSVEVFMDNVPGFPDNINLGSDGLFWVALPLPRQPVIDFLHQFPTVKALLPRLPAWMWQRFEDIGFVIAVSEEGKIEHLWNDVDGSYYKMVTNVQRFGNKLVLGSLVEDSVLVLDLLEES